MRHVPPQYPDLLTSRQFPGILEGLRQQHNECLEEIRILKAEKEKAVSTAEQHLGRLFELKTQMERKDDELMVALAAKGAAVSELDGLRGQLLELGDITLTVG